MALPLLLVVVMELVGAFFLQFLVKKMRSDSSEAMATVVKLGETTPPQQEVTVTYKNASGREAEGIVWVKTSSNPAIGDKVSILYPRNSESGAIRTKASLKDLEKLPKLLYASAAVFGVVLCVLLAMGQAEMPF